MCRLMMLSDTKKLAFPHFIIMSYMLALSERVGNTHGTGIGTNESYLKFGENASGVVISDDYASWVKETLKKDKYTTLVGHTRLASTSFRGTVNTQYSSDDAHPFPYGDPEGPWGAVYHNGTFKDYENMAKTLGLADDHKLTDTALFTKLLEKEIDNRAPTASELFSILKDCGKADYAMILTHITTPAITVLRGSKPLFKAETSYGLLINTGESNITDLPGVVNPMLKLMGSKLLTVETPQPIPLWTINRVTNGTFEKLQDIDKLKEISEPPYKSTLASHGGQHSWDRENYYNNYSRGTGFFSSIDDDLNALGNMIHAGGNIDVNKVVAQGEAINNMSILALDGVVGDEEMDRMFYDIHGKSGPWFTQKPDRLNEMVSLVQWVWEHDSKTTVTPKKLNDWVTWKTACRKQGVLSIATIYSQASKVMQAGFVIPWFLNDAEDLNTLVALISEIKHEFTNNRTT